MDQFELKIIRQYWVKDDGLDDKSDLCSHGTVFARIGDEILSSENNDGWTLSASALLLMRSAFNNHYAGEMENQLLPCCGHFMTFDETGNSVVIHGCPNGIDWDVIHKRNFVELKSINNSTAVIDIEKYRLIVLEFVNNVEEFYGNPNEKILPDNDKLTCDAFHLFWQNWHELKLQLKKIVL